jgi:ribonucleoside-diphosphate reductase alpha chain
MHVTNKILSDITVFSKYAKYIPTLSRRETWEELVTRNKDMHKRKYPHMVSEIESAYKFVYEKKVLPSMRSLQFGGAPIELDLTESLTVLTYQCQKQKPLVRLCSYY